VEHPDFMMLLFLLAAGFVASFVDSVVGGGGLIAMPALLFAGLPPTLALGTNKLAGTMSSLTSSVSFFFSGKIQLRVVGWLFPLSLAGSVFGTLTVKQIPAGFLKPMVVVMLIAVTIYTLCKKSWGNQNKFTGLGGRNTVILALGALVLGFYDGFFGPGTGSFLIFLFLLLGFDFVGASANSKVLNLASNLGSLATFFMLKSVNIFYGLPMGLAMIAGALVGSQVAIRKGSTYVKPLFLSVTTILIGKQLWDMLMG
jgi:uncharacterized protein